eukprot:8912261-Pyramimonas_sp.AAC.1
MQVPVHWIVKHVFAMSAETLQVFNEVLQQRPFSVCNSLFTENRRPRLYWCSRREAILQTPGMRVEPKQNFDLIKSIQVPKASASSR